MRTVVRKKEEYNCSPLKDVLLEVLCEKPMGMNAGECRQMVEAARRANLLLGVAQVFRFERAPRACVRVSPWAGGQAGFCAGRVVLSCSVSSPQETASITGKGGALVCLLLFPCQFRRSHSDFRFCPRKTATRRWSRDSIFSRSYSPVNWLASRSSALRSAGTDQSELTKMNCQFCRKR